MRLASMGYRGVTEADVKVDREIDIPRFLLASLAVAMLSATAGWFVYLIGDLFTTGGLKVPVEPGAKEAVTLAGSTVFRTGFLVGLAAAAVLWLFLAIFSWPRTLFGMWGAFFVFCATILPLLFDVPWSSRLWLAAINFATATTAVVLLLLAVNKVTRPRASKPPET
jgi:hypothetical protein